LTRNATLFEDNSPLENYVTHLILSSVDRPSLPSTAQNICRSTTTLPIDKAITWFDGDAQLDGSLCGAGGHFYISSHTSYRWTLNRGQGTNTKAELLGAWASLLLARRLNIEDLLLLGDSKVIIDWINDKVELRSAALECWKERTTEAKRLFKSFTTTHIYREENNIADQLSK
jgi:ribonuclease HI